MTLNEKFVISLRWKILLNLSFAFLSIKSLYLRSDDDDDERKQQFVF